MGGIRIKFRVSSDFLFHYFLKRLFALHNKGFFEHIGMESTDVCGLKEKND